MEVQVQCSDITKNQKGTTMKELHPLKYQKMKAPCIHSVHSV